MIRNIRLHGTLATAAGQTDFRFDCNNQHEMFAGLKALCPKIDITLRKLRLFNLIWTEEEVSKTPKAVEDGFRFSDKANYIHVCPHTEGAYFAIPYIIAAIVAVVISYVIMRLTMSSNNNNNASSRSTMFNGPVNSTDQGDPIPIVYGKKVLVGTQIIAADEDYYNILGTQITTTGKPDYDAPFTPVVDPFF